MNKTIILTEQQLRDRIQRATLDGFNTAMKWVKEEQAKARCLKCEENERKFNEKLISQTADAVAEF